VDDIKRGKRREAKADRKVGRRMGTNETTPMFVLFQVYFYRPVMGIGGWFIYKYKPGMKILHVANEAPPPSSLPPLPLTTPTMAL
jgi:hypothetical protein